MRARNSICRTEARILGGVAVDAQPVDPAEVRRRSSDLALDGNELHHRQQEDGRYSYQENRTAGASPPPRSISVMFDRNGLEISHDRSCRRCLRRRSAGRSKTLSWARIFSGARCASTTRASVMIKTHALYGSCRRRRSEFSMPGQTARNACLAVHCLSEAGFHIPPCSLSPCCFGTKLPAIEYNATMDIEREADSLRIIVAITATVPCIRFATMLAPINALG